MSRTAPRRIAAALALAGLSLVAAPLAWAGPHSDVASAVVDEDDTFDLHVTIDYELDFHRAAIKREFAGFPGTGPEDPIPIVKDLYFASTEHRLVPRLELGLFQDLSLMVALPIIISNSRTLSLDQRASPCVFPGGAEPATCIDRTNSTTITDGLLPTDGFDSGDVATGFPSGKKIFEGPNRAGLDQIHVGLTFAPMNQARDDTKPTWKMTAEMRFPIGSVAAFDRMDPNSETGVGRGLTELGFSTSIAKRVGWAEPYVEFWWVAPIAENSDSPFSDPGFGADRTEAQQQAGTRFGFEAIAWEDKASKQTVSLDMSTTFGAHFEGREYTEMWEIFQYAGDFRVANNPLILDSDPTRPGLDALSHPGISNVENYLTFGGRFGFRASLGDKVRFGTAFELKRNQSHIITFTDAGTDSNDSNEVVDPGTAEVNPLHVPLIDVVGHRYRVDESTDYILAIDARILF